MSDSDSVRSEKRREMLVLSLAPALILALILARSSLARVNPCRGDIGDAGRLRSD